ncbi:hypothetical protein OFC00_31210, partial [Escherichia coli]|nr:hypothetical protein [Escherichia coli]
MSYVAFPDAIFWLISFKLLITPTAIFDGGFAVLVTLCLECTSRDINVSALRQSGWIPAFSVSRLLMMLRRLSHLASGIGSPLDF